MQTKVKYRNIPFGYQYVDGKIVIHENNAETYRSLCNAYIKGGSLKGIADRLNEKNVAYNDGVAEWNKPRVARLIADKRYLGNETFPAIITNEVHTKIQTIKNQRNTQKLTNRNDGIFQLPIAVKCPVCGDIIKRRCSRRKKGYSQWRCKNSECDNTINKNDDELLADIIKLLNTVIDNPDMIIIPSDIQLESCSKIKDEKFLNADSCSEREKLTELAALRYRDIKSKSSRTQMIKDIFIASEKLTQFPSELLERTSTAIKLYNDGTIGIVLDNGQEIRN